MVVTEEMLEVLEETMQVTEETLMDSVLAVVMVDQECTGEAWEVPGEVG